MQGILEGITLDGQITDEEITELNQWLYYNSYLDGHYPYNTLLKQIRDILEDNVITEKEREALKDSISQLFNPLKELKVQIINFENSSFCLSGDFVHGSKDEISKYIESKQGIIHSNVKKSTNYVVVGAVGSQAYSNGSFGTKVKKALELGIPVLKESYIYE